MIKDLSGLPLVGCAQHEHRAALVPLPAFVGQHLHWILSNQMDGREYDLPSWCPVCETRQYGKWQMILPSGQPWRVDEPEMVEVTLQDLELGLWEQVRFNGLTRRWSTGRSYQPGVRPTILNHLLWGARLLLDIGPEALGLAAPPIDLDFDLQSLVAAWVLHDLHEAYLGDTITFLKEPNFKELEEKWWLHLASALLPSPHLRRLVKSHRAWYDAQVAKLDRIMLFGELALYGNEPARTEFEHNILRCLASYQNEPRIDSPSGAMGALQFYCPLLRWPNQ